MNIIDFLKEELKNNRTITIPNGDMYTLEETITETNARTHIGNFNAVDMSRVSKLIKGYVDTGDLLEKVKEIIQHE